MTKGTGFVRLPGELLKREFERYNPPIKNPKRENVGSLQLRGTGKSVTHSDLHELFHLRCVWRRLFPVNCTTSLRDVIISRISGVCSVLLTLSPLLGKLPQSGLPMRFPGDVVSFRVILDDLQRTRGGDSILLQHRRNQKLSLRKGQSWTFFLNCSRSCWRNNCARKMKSM
jgi:hypothetical protein